MRFGVNAIKTIVLLYGFIAKTQPCKRSLNRLRKTNYFSPAKHFDSFDFSTLYTSIPLDSLKMALTSLVMETYRVRGNKYLVVDKYGNACWSDTASTASYKTSIELRLH